MPYFVMSYYFMEVLYSVVNTPLVAQWSGIMGTVTMLLAYLPLFRSLLS